MSSDLLVRTERAVARACDDVRSVVDLCRNVQAVVTTVIPTDRWCGFAVDPATLVPTNGYHSEGVSDALLPRLLELELGSDDCNHLPALVRTRGGVATLSGATGGEPSLSARWRDVLVPCGLEYEMRALFSERGRAWGAWIMMRGPDVKDFTDTEIAIMRRLAPHVSVGFRRVLIRQQLDHGDDAREAGIVVVGGEPAEVRSMSTAAASWLDVLDDGGLGGPLPTAVMHSIHACRAGRPAAVRARTRTSRWVTVTAERLLGGDGEIGVIVQPSRPSEIANIVGAAHGLTDRESEVVVRVVAGHTNDEISQLLGVSTHTVKDHLKRIYLKLGVSSRGEMTSKLFYDEYLPRETDRRPVGADGWFLPD